jgi:hypothetical protein
MPSAVTLDHIRSRDHLALSPDGYEAPFPIALLELAPFSFIEAVGRHMHLLRVSQDFLRQKR